MASWGDELNEVGLLGQAVHAVAYPVILTIGRKRDETTSCKAHPEAARAGWRLSHLERAPSDQPATGGR